MQKMAPWMGSLCPVRFLPMNPVAAQSNWCPLLRANGCHAQDAGRDRPTDKAPSQPADKVLKERWAVFIQPPLSQSRSAWLPLRVSTQRVLFSGTWCHDGLREDMLPLWDTHTHAAMLMIDHVFLWKMQLHQVLQEEHIMRTWNCVLLLARQIGEGECLCSSVLK